MIYQKLASYKFNYLISKGSLCKCMVDDLVTKTRKNNLIFFIINLVLMALFLITIAAFVGAYGGGFVDYFVSGIISLIFFELFPFLWSIFIALFIYLGNKKKIKCLSNFGNFFMF